MSSQVELHTSLGLIRVELDEEKAPISSANFLQYVRQGQYDGTVFLRVIKVFIVQGGGFEPGMRQKPVASPIVNEADNGLKNKRYSLAMARTSDPHSATAQFFINAADNEFLNFKAKTGKDWGYAVFGRVVEGQDIVDRIESVKTRTDDVPTDDVVITKAVAV